MCMSARMGKSHCVTFSPLSLWTDYGSSNTGKRPAQGLWGFFAPLHYKCYRSCVTWSVLIQPQSHVVAAVLLSNSSRETNTVKVLTFIDDWAKLHSLGYQTNQYACCEFISRISIHQQRVAQMVWMPPTYPFFLPVTRRTHFFTVWRVNEAKPSFQWNTLSLICIANTTLHFAYSLCRRRIRWHACYA